MLALISTVLFVGIPAAIMTIPSLMWRLVVWFGLVSILALAGILKFKNSELSEE